MELACDTHRVVAIGVEGTTSSDLVQSLKLSTMPALRRWMKNFAGVDVTDFCGRPRCQSVSGAATIQMILRIPKSSMKAVLKASGADGIFLRPFYEDSEQENLKVVLLDPDMDLEGAKRCAARWPSSLGVVKTKKGFGVRVPGDDFQEAVKSMRPEEASKLLAQRFEVSGLPLFCGVEGVRSLIPEWNIEPLFTFRRRNTRSWVVASHTTPMQNKFQHQEGLAIIQPFERSQQSQRSAPTWSPPAKSRGQEAWPKPGEQAAAPPAKKEAESSLPPEGSASSSQDMARMIQLAVSAAVSPLEQRVTAIAAEMGRSRSTNSEILTGAQARTLSRANSRDRGRVPIGKRLMLR